MKEHSPRDVRNIALAGHSGSGKTSLAEAMLYVTGCLERLGRVDDGSATTDFDPDEIKRKISISLAMAPCEWKDRHLNFVDVPGYPDFAGDWIAALRVVDDVLLVAPAQMTAMEYGLETAGEMAQEMNKAEAVFINKMDRENADFFGVVNQLRERFGNHVVPAQIPIGSGESFTGVVDLVTMKATIGSGKNVREEAIPDDLLATAEEWRRVLVEIAAEGDDELIEEFLEGKELTEEEIERGIHEDLLSGRIIPVFCGSATKVIGIQSLLDHLTLEFESAEEAGEAIGKHPQTGAEEKRACDPSAPFSALVFKTIADPYVGRLTYFRVKSGRLRSDTHVWNANKEKDERIGQIFLLRGKQQEPVAEVTAGDLAAVAKLAVTTSGDTLCERNRPVIYPPIPYPEPTYTLAALAKTKADEDKLSVALARVAEEDPTFRTERSPDTSETLLLGQGETHLDVVVGRLSRFGAQINTSAPRIPYRETVTRSARAQGRHKKQTGGRGQFGDCWLTVEPNPGGGYEYVDKIVGGAIPRQYIPAVDKGVQQAMQRGIIAGHHVVDVRVTVDDGSFHPVDSSEAAFIMAGILGFQAAAKQAGPILMEPIMDVEITIPDAYLGDIMGDLNARRGHVLGIQPSVKSGSQTIQAEVPESEMQRYAVDLRSIARGRGSFTATRSRYAEVPAHMAQPVIDEYEKRKSEGHVSHD